jgi:hypothetical protein
MVIKRFINLVDDEFYRRKIKNGSWFIFDNSEYERVEIAYRIGDKNIQQLISYMEITVRFGLVELAKFHVDYILACIAGTNKNADFSTI